MASSVLVCGAIDLIGSTDFLDAGIWIFRNAQAALLQGLIAACAAASLAIGTRNGEQLT
jgi:hypothetical protein